MKPPTVMKKPEELPKLRYVEVLKCGSDHGKQIFEVANIAAIQVICVECKEWAVYGFDKRLEIQ